jgi:multidrug efflux system membrane fusion protein
MMGYDEPSSKRHPEVYGAPRPVRRSSPWPRRILLGVLALGVGGYLAANPDFIGKFAGSIAGSPAGGRGAGRGAGQAPPVRVAVAGTRDVSVVVRTIGTVLANSTVVVKSQVDGPLLAAMFREGQMVKKGDLLFRIDPAPFEAALRQSQAAVERDKAQFDSAKADADRAVMLADRGIVSAQQRDQLVATSKALAASIAADQAAVERAQLNLGYTTIRSPIDGKTGPYTINAGNQIHANDTAGLVTITQIQPVMISFNLPQGNLPQLQDRMREDKLIVDVAIRNDVTATGGGAAATPPTVTAANAAASDMEIPVKVDFIGNTVDARTGTIELRATFDNPDLRLVPGELVDVKATLQTLNNAVTVPREAVNVGQEGNYVFVIDKDMKAQMRPVKVLYQEPTLAALGSGVAPGERVVIDGQLRVTPGAVVSITAPEGQNPDATPPSPAAADDSARGTKFRTANPENAAPQAAGGPAVGSGQNGRSGG